MSKTEHNERSPSLLAGRWQIPLALIAAIAGGLTLYRLIPAPPPIDFESVLADVALLEQGGDTVAAADAVANLLAMEPPLSVARQAVLHDRLAELLFRAEQDREVHNPENVRSVLEHNRAARDGGLPASPPAMLRTAFAYEWLGDDEAALRAFRSAIDESLPVDDRRTALRSMVGLLGNRPAARLERQQVLDHLLEDDGISGPYFWWGLRRAVRDALDENNTPRARELLAKHGDRLKNSELKGYLEYLQAYIMLHEGRLDEALPLVRWIDDWLGARARSTHELDNMGYLPALNRWLMGRIHLAEERPQDALADFDQTLELRPGAELRVAANVGRGQALAALDRHAAALEAFRSALGETNLTPGGRRHAVAEFRRALLDLSEQQRKQGDNENALAYLALAAELSPDQQPRERLELLERLGQAYRAAARQTDDVESQREYHERAGRHLEQASELVEYDEPRLARLSWVAAEEYDQAGRIGDMRRLLGEFVRGRSDDPHMPQALLQLGRACQTYGDLDEALRWYARVIDEYPRLEEAARAKALTAGVHISLGSEHYADAERILAGVLTGGSVSPNAAVYRDALLTLCELLHHQTRYAEAISRLRDFLRLYPADSEYLRARFMLADAYRRSAYALRANPPAGAASRERFRTAAGLFDELLNDLESARRADPSLRAYARLALFYRGDCLFELNEPDTLQEALTTYRNAAARYDGQPAALTAQVQIANVFLRLGDVTEAARAVERARWLLRGIPAEAYGEPGLTRSDWERFLAVVSSSNLFKGVFNTAP